jgi:tripartite-type tricarboxylate transporter receptor subunit TctC
LPADVAKTLYDAFAAAAADPSIVDLMEKRSLNPFVATGEALAKTIAGQSEGFKKLIEASK